MEYRLKSPELLRVKDLGGSTVGGSQLWYRERWPRMSGCGPTAASNIVWYYARTRTELSSLCDAGGADRAHFLRLMDEMFSFVTPGLKGVNTPGIFTDGIVRYGKARGVVFTPRVLETGRNSDISAVRNFIFAALELDTPVAFLNLSNGSLSNLESWHWVTIIALNARCVASVADQGHVFEIDLGEWLRTSRLGGALVYVTVSGQ